MKKAALLVTVCFIFFQACDSDDCEGLYIVGSGNVNDYPIDLAPFDEVALFGPVNMRLIQGPEQDVVVKAEPEIIELISYEVINGRLEIGIREDVSCLETEEGVRIDITIPDIEAIFVVGASGIESFGGLDLDRLVIDVLGAANLVLTGSVEEQVIDINGQAVVANFDLNTIETRIIVNGSGTMEVTCESVLDIKVNGAATIRYKGNPQISQVGSGSITLINSN